MAAEEDTGAARTVCSMAKMVRVSRETVSASACGSPAAEDERTAAFTGKTGFDLKSPRHEPSICNQDRRIVCFV